MFRRKIVEPLKNLLLQGVTPEKLALSLAFGTTIACLPIIGVTMVTCMAVATLLRLNHVAIQVANYAAYPLQFLMLVPFLRAGERIFGLAPVPLDPGQILSAYRADFFAANRLYLAMGLRGVVAWSLVFPFVTAALYFGFVPVLRRLNLHLAAKS